jgi:hypothetical protein
MAWCRGINGHPGEFKYSKTKERLKDCFFACTSKVEYNIRAIVVDKSKIYSHHLRSSPSALKSYAIRQLLSHGFGTIHNAACPRPHGSKEKKQPPHIGGNAETALDNANKLSVSNSTLFACRIIRCTDCLTAPLGDLRLR